MVARLQAKLNNITWKLHEQRGRMTENLELRKHYIEATHAAQLAADRRMLESRIASMQPSLQRQFVMGQLRKLEQRKKE